MAAEARFRRRNRTVRALHRGAGVVVLALVVGAASLSPATAASGLGPLGSSGVPMADDGVLDALRQLGLATERLPIDPATRRAVHDGLDDVQRAIEDGDACGAVRAIVAFVERLDGLPGAEPEKTTPAVPNGGSPTGLLGGLLTGVVATLLGTVDALLGTGTAVVNDVLSDVRRQARLLSDQLSAALPGPLACRRPPAPTFEVDRHLQPSQRALPPLVDGGMRRPVARLVDAFGTAADFVEDELLIRTSDRVSLDAFLARWKGELLQTVPAHAGLPEVHLVRVDASGADPEQMGADLQEIDPLSRGAHRVSSTEGLHLLAAAATEGAGGTVVGVNWISEAHQFLDRVTAEAPAAINDGAYSSNAFTWPYMTGNNQQQAINGAEAWRVLELAGRLQNRVKLAVVDGGFLPNPDFPAGWSAPQDAEDDTGEPSFDPTPSKAWHGTNVASVAAGVPDNAYGTAGSAGPVADLLIVDVEADMFTQMAGVHDAANAGARIINMSFGTSLPATVSFSAFPFSSQTAALREFSDVLVFASAGNDGKDVDEEDCAVLPCWEASFYMPCENGGVVCVGGLGFNSSVKDTGSNYGYEWCEGLCDVDIFGPYWTYVGPEPANVPGGANLARLATGTSYASPFVAGVAALIWAADPGLSADAAEHILLNVNVNGSTDPRTHRYVNALGAVLAALGGNVPPYVEIEQPASPAVVRYGVSVPMRAKTDDYEDGLRCCQVTWSSDVDGVLGSWSGNSQGFAYTFRTPGERTLTATATDSSGATRSTSVKVVAVNASPVVTIQEPLPPPGQSAVTLYRGAAYQFRATVTDPNERDAPCSYITWSSSRGGDTVTGSGCRAVLSFPTNGVRVVTATATDVHGVKHTQSVQVTVVDPPLNSPPIVDLRFPHEGQTLTAFSHYRLRASAYDPDEPNRQDHLTYRWEVRSSEGVEQVGTGPEVWWYTGFVGCGKSVDKTVTVSVTDANGTVSQSANVVVRMEAC